LFQHPGPWVTSCPEQAIRHIGHKAGLYVFAVMALRRAISVILTHSMLLPNTFCILSAKALGAEKAHFGSNRLQRWFGGPPATRD
jgi:hypothetical protein